MSTTNNYHIAIVGPAEIVSGFSALGVDVLEASNGEEMMVQLSAVKRQMLEVAEGKKYAVVCVVESLLEGIDMTEYTKIISGPLPAVVLLPGPDGSSGLALERLRRLAERAVGSAII